MPQPLPRFDRGKLLERQRQVLDQILAEVGLGEETDTVAGATAPLDHRRLRGIPSVGRGVSGAIGGTDPMRALLARNDGRGSSAGSRPGALAQDRRQAGALLGSRVKDAGYSEVGESGGK